MRQRIYLNRITLWIGLVIFLAEGIAAAEIKVKVEAGPYRVSPGGEFVATILSSDDPGLPAGYQFSTFCLEKSESVTLGNSYYVVLNTAAVRGGESSGQDPLDPETAWLYYQFSQMTLPNYNFVDQSARKASAEALQHAIWSSEGEEGAPASGSAAEGFINQAIAAGWSDIDPVRVMNLYKDADLTQRAQDLLVVPQCGTIIVEKQTDPNDDPNSFCFTGDASGRISDNGQIVVTGLYPGTYTSTEIVPDGWALTSITLDDDNSTADLDSQTATFQLEAGETIKAVFTNCKLGTIIIKKVITEDCIPECNEPIEFTFDGDVGGQISQGQQLVITDLVPGPYSTTEVAPGDWLVDSITVDDDNSTVYIDDDAKTGTVLFQLDPGEVVTAVFTNRKPVVVLELSSTVGGRVTWPGEGVFEYCQDTEICMEVEWDSSLYTFLGWRGTLWASAPTNAGESIDLEEATDECGNPIETDYSVLADCTPLTLSHDHNIWAAFESVLEVLYVDDDAPNDVSPYDLSVGDPCENGTVDHPFDSIQEAIEVAKPGATVVVLSGTYNESLDFFNKVITVTSDDPESADPVLEYPVIQGAEGDPVVTFDYCKDANMVLQGFVLTGGNDGSTSGVRCRDSNVVVQNCLIVGNRRVDSGSAGGGGLWCRQSQATLINCTLVQNYGGANGAGLYAWDESSVTVLDSIVWDNLPVDVLTDDTSVITFVTCDVGMDTDPVDGNLNVDPEFVMPGYWEHALYPGVVVDPTQDGSVWVTGDYHLSESSPCIDTGDPLADFSQEPEPNGGQVNMGAYGNTPQATTTPTP